MGALFRRQNHLCDLGPLKSLNWFNPLATHGVPFYVDYCCNGLIRSDPFGLDR